MKTIERKIVGIVRDSDEAVFAIADDGTAWYSVWAAGVQQPYKQILPLPPREVTA